MALVKWDPLREIEDMFDRYTHAIGAPRIGNNDAIASGDWSPSVDISESDSEFVVKAELPEVKKSDVKVTVENGMLTLQGERKQEKEEKTKKFHRVERRYGSFYRSFSLPANVDESGIKAVFKDGMLNLKIPKTPEAKNKTVQVKVS